MRHYSITFNTTAGTKRSIRVNNPNPDLPLNELSGAVEQVIENDVFDQEKGGLDNLNRLELTTMERITVL